MKDASPNTRWLVMLHQLPAKPPYLRAKVGRRLHALGAIPLKNAVHVLPKRGDTAQAFVELVGDIRAGEGDATLIEARFLAGQTDGEVQEMFNAARNSDYEELTNDAIAMFDRGPVGGAEIERLRKRLKDAVKTDFFEADGRLAAESAIRELEARRHMHPDVSGATSGGGVSLEGLQRSVWVTRRGVHVDRIASAWLIRRFIDADASFKLVEANGYSPAPGEIRFDMLNGEFSHEEDRCTFETLVRRRQLDGDQALVSIGEIVHQLDISDGKFERIEAFGVGAVIEGICTASADDRERLAHGAALLDQLYSYFGGQGGKRADGSS